MEKYCCILLILCLIVASFAACGRQVGATQSDTENTEGGTLKSADAADSENIENFAGEGFEDSSDEASEAPKEIIYDYHIEERWVENGEEPIYGKAYLPHGDGKYPCVIWSHGIGSTNASGNDYMRDLAKHGYLGYTFDYPGGSTAPNKSGGDGLQMSVISEMENLRTVMAAVAAWEDVDPTRIVLIGESQGGLVSSLVAAETPDEVPLLMLLYPAFSIMSDAEKVYASLDDVPEVIDLFNGYMTLGRKYYEDIWGRDPYEEIGAYEGPVLIVHGTADAVVPIGFSDKAAEIYKNVEYHKIEGGEHGFSGATKREATSYILDFLAENLK